MFASLTLGGLIALGFTAFLGHDADHDLSHDLHADLHADAAPSFLSPRAFFAFLVGFSATGAIATCYNASAPVATLIGLLPGLGVAALVYFVTLGFYNQQANSSVQPGQVVGSTGTIVTAIRAGGIGEANISVRGQLLPYTTISDDGSDIPANTVVTVTRDLGDRVAVRPVAAH